MARGSHVNTIIRIGQGTAVSLSVTLNTAATYLMGGGFGLDPAPFSGNAGAFRLQGCQCTRLPLPLLYERRTGPALAFYGGQGGIGPAPPGRLLNG
jgi:hypothetical protein